MKVQYFTMGVIVGTLIIFAAGAVDNYKQDRTQWEYGRLGWARSNDLSLNSYSWNSPSEKEIFPSNTLKSDEIAKFLKIKNESFSVNNVLNLIGKEGWELVLIDEAELETLHSTMYHFKRPKQ